MDSGVGGEQKDQRRPSLGCVVGAGRVCSVDGRVVAVEGGFVWDGRTGGGCFERDCERLVDTGRWQGQGLIGWGLAGVGVDGEWEGGDPEW